MQPNNSPIEQLPPPLTIHQRIGQLCRELTLLRRLLRLSQAAQQERRAKIPTEEEGVRDAS
jgi:hypothetical protein